MISQQTKKHFYLTTHRLILKPYCRRYVEQYHSWFDKYPQILYLTGSEPLKLEQEIDNHKSWLKDPSKYTFLVFTKQTQNEKQQMIGDVNLFFSQWIQPNEAQINLMVAVKEQRRKGYSTQIMEAIQHFSCGMYNRNTLIAKIKDDNEASINFFLKIGYQFVTHNEKFQQKEYRKVLTYTKQQAYKKLEQFYKIDQEKNLKTLYDI